MKCVLNTKTDIDRYVKEKGLFPTAAQLVIENLREIKQSAEGYVNPIYRIRNANRSVIMKQITAMPISRSEENDEHLSEWALDTDRIRNEILVLLYWNAICPGICPEVYLLDEDNGVIIMEDLSDLSLLRYEMCRLKKQNGLGEKIGTFFARNLFYSSEFCLTAYKREAILSLFENSEYNALEQFLFDEVTIVSFHRETPPETHALRRRIIDNEAIQKELRRLRTVFLTQKECVIHTDLHSSNMMVDRDAVKIIDTEFAGFGPIAQDFGRLTASFVLNYCSMFAEDGQHSPVERQDYQQYILRVLKAFYDAFEAEFTRLYEAHKAENYVLSKLDVQTYFTEHFTDSMAYTALNAASRVAVRGLCYDLERLTADQRVYPINLIFHFCEDVLSGAVSMNNADDLIAYLQIIQEKYPK